MFSIGSEKGGSWFTTVDNNDMMVKKNEDLSLSSDMSDDDIIETEEVDIDMTDEEVTTSMDKCDPLEVRQPRKDKHCRRPELVGLFRFSTLYHTEQETYAKDELTISYRAGFPKNHCFGSLDHFSSHGSSFPSDDDLTMSLRGGTFKGHCSPSRSMDSFPSMDSNNHMSSLAYQAMVIAEKLTMHNDGIDMLHNEKADKNLTMTAPTTGVNTAVVTRRNSIDEVMMIQ